MKSNRFIDFEDVSFVYPPGQAAPPRRRQSTREPGPDATAHPALRNVTFRVHDGEYVAVLGHNGSGKSTLARHCNALLLPTRGRVLVGGMDTSESANRSIIRDTVGMVFQNPDSQIIATVVEDDVAWSLTFRGLPAPQIRERVDWAMDVVGIRELRALPPHKLSGGQRQRVAIAGVLALRPRCIVADEPTSLLDPLSRRETVALLHQLNAEHGIAVIHITHLVDEAIIADRVAVMEDGEIALEGEPSQVFSDLDRLRALHIAIPEPLELASRLRAVGVLLSPRALTVESIAREIAR